MEGSPFIFDKPVTGKNFIGRKSDVTILSNMLVQGENIAVWEPAKSGKESLLLQTFYSIRLSGRKFQTVRCSLLNTRTVADFCIRLGGALLTGISNTPDDLANAAVKYLRGTHFVFDPALYINRGQVLSLNWDIDDVDIRAILSLPYRISEDREEARYVVLEEFQNIMLCEGGEHLCSLLYGIFEGLPSDKRLLASYLFVGSEVNAMKDIFEVRRLFYRRVEHLPLSALETKEIIDHVSRGFLTSGKVIDRDLLMGACKLFKGNIWYINHFAYICDSISKGYIMEHALTDALDVLVAVHEPRFVAMMNGLTTFQVCLLRAIMDGHTRFSSAEVISRYNLNSSANVRRLKDALCRKEIVTFDEHDEPVILDPLFEWWARKYFFEIPGE